MSDRATVNLLAVQGAWQSDATVVVYLMDHQINITCHDVATAKRAYDELVARVEAADRLESEFYEVDGRG